MSIRPTQPQSVGGVLDTTFQLYKASVVKVIPLSLLMVVAASPPTIYIFTQGGSSPSDPFAMLRLMGSPGYLVATVASWIATLLIVAPFAVKLTAIADGNDVSIGTAFGRVLPRLLSLVLTLICYQIVVALTLVLAAVPYFAMGRGATSILLGLVLLAPAIVLSVSLVLFIGTNLFDGKGPIAALGASHRLVWGNWWRTTAILGVGFIIMVVMYTIAALLVGVLVPLVVIGGGTENFALIGMLSGVLIDVVMNVLMAPFYIGLFLAIYWDLKLRKEGGDLAARVGSLNPA
jgi:hypothetical protein